MMLRNKYQKDFLLAIAVLLLLFNACGKTHYQTPNKDNTFAHDSALGLVVADTIIYDVIIRNPNPDDSWVAHCLKGLNDSMLINSIFEMIYTRTAVAYNNETGEKLTPKQVEKIESRKDFSRNNIGMIQFKEVWYLKPDEAVMTKKVLSMVLGYNFYTSEGELIGHKSLFRVEMKRDGGQGTSLPAGKAGDK